MKYLWFYETDIGVIGIAEKDGSITDIFFGKEPPTGAYKQQETALIAKAAGQMDEYLNGKRKDFELPLAPEGTPFQQAVWAALLTVPYGQTASYGDIAQKIGNPKAVRAVGGANNKNPIVVVIPCHRIIGAGGALTGYGGGLAMKEHLLKLEGGPYA